MWVMDSGASQHMTYKKEFFSAFEDIKHENRIIKLGDNRQLKVQGKGTVNIQKKNNGVWQDALITNVLYVPDLRKNLFSEGAIASKGMKIVKEKNNAYVYNEDDELMAHAVRSTNNLYYLQFRVITNCEANVASDSDKLKLWHTRMGHISVKTIKRMISEGQINDINLKNTNDFFCEACQYGKSSRLKFGNVKREVAPGEVIYSDLCGPMSVPTINGSNYFILFKDEHSGYRVIFCIKHKSDALSSFQTYVNMSKNKFGHSVKILHVDNGTEYMNANFKNYLNKTGIELEKTAPYTPEQNGKAEREMRTIVESARSMLYEKDLPTELWGEAVNTAVYLLNRSPNSKTVDKTPYEIWTGKKPVLKHVRTFGCEGFVHIPK